MLDAPLAADRDAPATTPAVETPSLSIRIEWFDDWEESTRKAQQLARRDRWYYDNVQWTPEEVAVLEERKQPVLTKNRIARKINFILGEEIRKRIDPVARPRTPQHEDSARAATDALRFVADEQRFNEVRSAVLKNVLIEGYGGALKEVEQDEDGEFRHVLRHIEWDRLFYDPHSRAPDFSDSKYLGLVLWMDLDDAIIEWPDAAEALREAITRDVGATSETTEDTPRRWADKRRNRIKIVEMYYRIGRDWYRALFTQASDLEQPAQTAYLDEKGRHSVCPLVMMSCYVDPDGSRYGCVRQLISPQDEINKRSSKALHALNTRQVIAEDSMVRDPQKFMRELAKPDGFATGVAPGALQDGRVVVQSNNELGQAQLALLQEAKQDIDTIGPSSATLPDMPSGASGRAFIARQQAASQELGTIFDQLRSWSHRVFQIDWLCVRQYWTEEKWLRVTDDQELTGYRFVAINKQVSRSERFQELLGKGSPLPQALYAAAGEFAPMIMSEVQRMAQQLQAQAQMMGQQPEQIPPEQLVTQHPMMSEPMTINQVDQMLVDIVIDEAPDTAVLAQEEFDTLSSLMPAVVQSRPDMAGQMAKLLIRASQLPSKRELLAELDKAPDPQQVAAQQQAQQIQQQAAQAKVAVDQTRAALQQAQTAKAQAEAGVVQPRAAAEIESTQAQTIERATQAAMQAAPIYPEVM